MLNSMCLRCACLGVDCNGTENKVWSGCIYKKPLEKGDNTSELRKKLVDLSRFEEMANKAEEEMMAEPTNVEKEKAFDEAYQTEYNAFMAVAELIVKMTGGRVDIKTAREMVRTRRNEILSLAA